jgi:hypothetical protein
MKELTSSLAKQHHTTKKDELQLPDSKSELHYCQRMETQKGKASILPPAPKKSFLDRASNRLARTIS